MKQTHKRQTVVGFPYLVAALPLILAACSKPAVTDDIAQRAAPASATASVIEGSASSSASSPSSAAELSAPVASETGANAQSGSTDADAADVDESGAPVGSVMKADVSADGSMATPFGKLSVSADNVLMLDDKPVNPGAEGNNSLSFVAQVALKNRRAVLVQNNGGTGCPAMYRWMIVSDGSYTVGPEFGSCSDLVKVSIESGALVVTMPGFAGPSEPTLEQKRAARRHMKYGYDGKTLTENGRPLTPTDGAR
ncbi:hypothetical protein [Paraburkholderia caffeinilytica]|uniref:hypothetical protein n=1 Tax=Paraburkholderia caffeinilytica TaxID=1761016 RepID=UPI0038B961F1